MVRLSDAAPPGKGRGRNAAETSGLRGRSLAYVAMNTTGNNSILVVRIQFTKWNTATLAYGAPVGPSYCDEACVRVRSIGVGEGAGGWPLWA